MRRFLKKHLSLKKPLAWVLVGLLAAALWVGYPPRSEGPPIPAAPIVLRADLREDNAAYWYLKATTLYKNSLSNYQRGSLAKSLSRVVISGWALDVGKAITFQGREEILTLADVGLKQEYCLFPTIRFPLEPQPNVYDVRFLGTVFAARGRASEESGDEEVALQDYLRAVSISHDMAYGGNLFRLMFSTDMRALFAIPIWGAVRTHKFNDPSLLKEVRLQLKTLREEQPSLSTHILYEWVAAQGLLNHAYRNSPEGLSLFNLLYGKKRAFIVAENFYRRLIAREARPYYERLRKSPHQECGMPANWLLWRAYLARDPVPKTIVSELTRTVGRAEWVYARDKTMMRMLETSLALEAARLEKGAYPDSLSDIVPAYLEELPLDEFRAGPLHYERTGSGYRLSSRGQDFETLKKGIRWLKPVHVNSPDLMVEVN